jgi:hypothetical protein
MGVNFGSFFHVDGFGWGVNLNMESPELGGTVWLAAPVSNVEGKTDCPPDINHL